MTGEVFARVEGIFASPVITAGPGRVVLSTIRHLGEDLYELTLRDAAGGAETLGVTAPHRFYSESRGWVAAADLQSGETLRGLDGPLTVEGVVATAGVAPVYNFSVEADHVYYAGGLSALTHNSYVDVVKKAINSDIIHAAERAVERLGLPDVKVAADELRALTAKITGDKKFPVGSFPDPKRVDSVLVPFRSGYASYEVGKNGTARLRTVVDKPFGT